MKTTKTLFGILTITAGLFAPSITSAAGGDAIDPKGIRAIGLLSCAMDSLNHGLPDSPEVVQKALLNVGTPDFLQTAGDCDLRIVNWSQNTNMDLPVAYILFNKGNFSKGVEVTDDSMTNAIQPAVESAYQESLGTQHDTMPPLNSHLFGRFSFSSTNFSGLLEFKSCSAVGLALFAGTFPDESQGLQGRGNIEAISFILIEPGSSLQKSIMSAPYFTNVFAIASVREDEIVKPFVGSWKARKGDDIKQLDVGSDHTFRCKWNFGKETTTGNYWVVPGNPKVRYDYDKIVFLKNGKNWISGTIRSDGTLGLGGSYEGPSGFFKKDK